LACAGTSASTPGQRNRASVGPPEQREQGRRAELAEVPGRAAGAPETVEGGDEDERVALRPHEPCMIMMQLRRTTRSHASVVQGKTPTSRWEMQVQGLPGAPRTRAPASGEAGALRHSAGPIATQTPRVSQGRTTVRAERPRAPPRHRAPAPGGDPWRGRARRSCCGSGRCSARRA